MKIIQRYPLISFFVMAYAITWTLQLSGIFLAAQYEMTLSNETNFVYFLDFIQLKLSSEQALTYILFTLGAGPLFSALIITWSLDGKNGLKMLWQQSTKWNVGAKWYLVTLGLPILLSLASLGIGLLSTGGKFDYNPKLPLSNFIPFFIYMLVFTGITEEPGWRGFALPRLQSRYNAEKSSWILGVLWGVWHFPFIIYYNYSLGIIPLLFSFFGLTLGIVGWTIVNTWIYNNTQSVWLMILLHGWGNTIQSYLILSSNSYTAQTLYGVLPWVIAIILMRVYGKENLMHGERPKTAY
ncbi:MAG: CPBP family intramembrane metalloprotease [Anaerolineales bacterium]|nr:CPBP family intramembrane metalloprotease [Anaerolineales bacterium]